MLINKRDINYAGLEEIIENRLRMYVNLEKTKTEQDNLLSYNHLIYPKNSPLATSFHDIATVYFDIVNNLEYHYYDGKIMLQGFIVYEDARRNVDNFILQTTLEDFQVEFLSLRNNLQAADTVYINYIIRIPILETDNERSIRVFVNSQLTQLQTRGKYYELMQDKIINQSRIYKLNHAQIIIQKKKNYYKKNAKKIVAKTNKYKKDNRSEATLKQQNYRIFNKTIKKLYKETNKANLWVILGCNAKEFRKYIEKKMTPGMSWSNWGEWDLKYITPISNLNNHEEVIRLNHHTNFKPVWIDKK